MALVTAQLLPYNLIHSSLVGTNDIVQLRHFKIVEARYDKLNDPVVTFFKETTFLEDIRGFLKCSVLSSIGPFEEIKTRIENIENLKSIRDISLLVFKSVGGKWTNFKMLFLTYDKTLCSVETSIRIRSTVGDLLDVKEEDLNKFHIVVNTSVGQIQSSENKENK